MAETLTKLIVDCATGEKQRLPFTPEEVAEHNERKAAWEAELAAQNQAKEKLEADKASAIAKLTALGLTEDEALALVGQ